jgi:hypothetical protein
MTISVVDMVTIKLFMKYRMNFGSSACLKLTNVGSLGKYTGGERNWSGSVLNAVEAI